MILSFAGNRQNWKANKMSNTTLFQFFFSILRLRTSVRCCKDKKVAVCVVYSVKAYKRLNRQLFIGLPFILLKFPSGSTKFQASHESTKVLRSGDREEFV